MWWTSQQWWGTQLILWLHAFWQSGRYLWVYAEQPLLIQISPFFLQQSCLMGVIVLWKYWMLISFKMIYESTILTVMCRHLKFHYERILKIALSKLTNWLRLCNAWKMSAAVQVIMKTDGSLIALGLPPPGVMSQCELMGPIGNYQWHLSQNSLLPQLYAVLTAAIKVIEDLEPFSQMTFPS